MADVITPNLGLVLPEVGAEDGKDLWGDKLNENFEIIDEKMVSVDEGISQVVDVDTTTDPPAIGDGLVWDGTNWVPGPAGGGMFKGDNGTVGTRKGDIFRVSEQQLDANVTIASDENASAPGPLAVGVGFTLTVDTGGNLVIL
jgi:hypothetical protein